jgi:glycosyltransferase involved in cell wall biosynthesis
MTSVSSIFTMPVLPPALPETRFIGHDGPMVALIPAYNEARFIGSLVLAARNHVDMVIVVDDGSSDQTVEIARRAGATVIRHKVNQGKAAAVNTGFAYLRQLKPGAVVMLDGDGQHAADDIPGVLGPILGGEADIVVGSRFLGVKSDIPVYRQIGQHGLNLATNLASGVRISDTQSGYRAFSARAIEELSFQQGGFSIESEMQFQIRESRLRVAEVPIKVTYAEPAKRNPFHHGMQVINGIARLLGQTRPLLYFCTSGLFLLALGILLGVYMIDIFSRTHELAVGYGLITVILSVVGMLLLFVGFILHSTRGMLVELRQSLLARMGDSPATVLGALPELEHEARP